MAETLLAAAPYLSAASAGVSVVGSIMGGTQQQAVYKAQAKQSELAAKTEEIKGRQQADMIRRSLQSTLASQSAAFAARGISLNGGTPGNIAANSRTQASRDIQTAQFGSDVTAETNRAQGKQYKIQGNQALSSGYTSAFGTAATYGVSLLKK